MMKTLKSCRRYRRADDKDGNLCRDDGAGEDVMMWMMKLAAMVVLMNGRI